MPANVSGRAYALTALSPIRDGWTSDGIAYADVVRDRLQGWNTEPNSPMTGVPNTYLCRFFVLDDVYHQSLPGAGVLDTLSDLLPVLPNALRKSVLPAEDHLKSRYLVFSSELHGGVDGDVDAYLRGMWGAIESRIREVWGWCHGFEQVTDGAGFAAYIRKCQLPAALFFNGSNDDPLAEQLKALYLKQEFTRFAVDSQGLDPATLRLRMAEFMQRVDPPNIAGPTWSPGRYRL
ncbi:MAG TPA: hypothetical protein VLA61_09665 [Ideonella sp.]|uniref:hypothetical protein n=1 Tax=Ideonella sp. TaxID=1929293 RepID=UPI002C812BFA|nr:hypothetical protein [Ideonella sp.]HSI48525.1 hypothetical protein [Ideonella sp.]